MCQTHDLGVSYTAAHSCFKYSTMKVLFGRATDDHLFCHFLVMYLLFLVRRIACLGTLLLVICCLCLFMKNMCPGGKTPPTILSPSVTEISLRWHWCGHSKMQTTLSRRAASYRTAQSSVRPSVEARPIWTS